MSAPIITRAIVAVSTSLIAFGPSQAGARTHLTAVLVARDSQAEAELLRLLHRTETSPSLARFDFVPLPTALNPASTRKRLAEEEAGKAAIAAGSGAYNDLDTVKALAQFQSAIASFEQTDLSRQFPNLIQAMVLKVAAMVANGDSKGAEAELRRLLVLSPRVELPGNYFPPDVLALAERIRRENPTRLNLDVQTHPRALIAVDGQVKGISPLLVTGLLEGEHYVTAVAPGCDLAQQKVSKAQVELTLPPAEQAGAYLKTVGQIAKYPMAKERDLAARQLARAAGVDQIFLGILSKSAAGQRLDATVLRIDESDGHNEGYARGTLSLEEKVGPQWDALIDPVLTRDAPRAGGPVTHFESGFRWSRRATGFTLLGIGGALLLTGAWMELEALNLDAYRQTLKTQIYQDAVLQQEQGYQLGGLIAAAVGVAAAGTGTYFALSVPGEETQPSVAPPPPAPPPSHEPTGTTTNPSTLGPSSHPDGTGTPSPRREDDDLKNY